MAEYTKSEEKAVKVGDKVFGAKEVCLGNCIVCKKPLKTGIFLCAECERRNKNARRDATAPQYIR